MNTSHFLLYIMTDPWICEVSNSSRSEGQGDVQTDEDDDQETVVSSRTTSASINKRRRVETNVAMKTVVPLKNNGAEDPKTMVQSRSNTKTGIKWNRELLGLQLDNSFNFSGFTRSPCEALRPRAREDER